MDEAETTAHSVFQVLTLDELAVFVENLTAHSFRPVFGSWLGARV